MATDLTPLYDALRNADAAGDTAGAQRLAAYIKTQIHVPQSYDTDGRGNVIGKTGSLDALRAQDPTSGMSGLAKFGAGYGKAGRDLAQGAGQMLGLTSRQDVANSRALDAPLMATGAGKAGDITGSLMDLLPAAAIPGANTLAGAAAIGAGTGLLQPSTSTGETLTNTGLGAAAGPASLLAGRAVGAVGKGLKASLWDPFTQPGQQRIAANVLQNFAGGPKAAQDAAAALQSMPSVLPGVTPTTAELAGNAGLAQLQKTLSSNPSLMQDFTARAQGNRGAMVDALSRIAGTPKDMAEATHMRSTLAGPLYDEARGAQVVADPHLNEILSRPSASSAWARAQQLAAENGTPLVAGVDMPEQTVASPLVSALSGNKAGAPFTTTIPAQSATYSGRGIQYLKMGLNDIANSGPQMGMGAHEVGAIKGTLGSLNNWIEKNVPQLRAADASYRDLSRPINQMEAGQALSNKLLPSLSDYGANTGMNGASFATALRNGDSIAADVTGSKSMSLSDVLNASQMKTIRQIGEQLARSDNAAKLGAPKGSPTAQNLISQNVLGQFLGPLGLPNNMAGRMAGSALGRTIAKPGQLLYGAVEPDILNILAQHALDPQKARAALQAVQRPSALSQALWNRQGLLGPVGGVAARGLLGNSSQ